MHSTGPRCLKYIGIIVFIAKITISFDLLQQDNRKGRKISTHKNIFDVGKGSGKSMIPNVYSYFEHSITLEKIERQSGAKQQQFRNELERLSNAQFTEEDWNKWKSRSLLTLPPQEEQAAFFIL